MDNQYYHLHNPRQACVFDTVHLHREGKKNISASCWVILIKKMTEVLKQNTALTGLVIAMAQPGNQEFTCHDYTLTKCTHSPANITPLRHLQLTQIHTLHHLKISTVLYKICRLLTDATALLCVSHLSILGEIIVLMPNVWDMMTTEMSTKFLN